MLLAIDCGNTNTVFGVYEGPAPAGAFRAVFRMKTAPGRRAADYVERIGEEISAAGLPDGALDGAAIASVVPGTTRALAAAARELTGATPVVVGEPGVELGLSALVDDPGEVGADRLVNAVAAHVGWPGPVIVLDFGTATTFDVITAEGDYAGGVIAPGINLALDALHAGAAMLPRIAVARPDHVIGRGTVSAMQSGIYWGYVGLIEGIVARIESEYGPEAKFTVIATGGLASLFAGGTDVIHATDPDLTLRGLVLVHQRNRAS